MRFSNAIAFVESIPESTAFYRDVIGIAPIEEYETFVLFANGFSIHDGGLLHDQSFGEPAKPGQPWGRRNLDLYFVSDNLEADFERLAQAAVIVHPIRPLPSGELAFRCLDPDGHLIEIGDAGHEVH
jgi:catechol 2,3-dioxygenase-like lactoylglutathione lyase family enzyme